MKCLENCTYEPKYKYNYTSDDQKIRKCVDNCTISQITENKKYNYFINGANNY